MLKLTFYQTSAERMVRAASTLVFSGLVKAGCSVVPLSELASNAQYGYTESASTSDIGPKFVRITDLKAGRIDWETVPHCKCPNPERYLLQDNDLLFARTGATTGKTHLVKNPPSAVFASYLIRVRPKVGVMPEYLYAFFQSDDYWLQISDNKEGSAQPNVNGRKLLSISVPIVGLDKQQEITRFLDAVRARQVGDTHPLPELASPLDEQSRTVSYIEELAGKVAEATRLQKEITKQMDALCRALITSPPDGVLTPTQMSELLVMREPDVKVEATFSYHFAGVYCFGRGVFAGHQKNGSEFAYRHLTKVQKGNFIYPKLMAWEGALGVVPENCDGLYVSPEFPVFEVRKDRVLPEVLDTYFRMPSVWSDLAGISTGTNVRRRRLHPRAFLQYKFPLPSMKVQHQFCVVRRSIEQAKRVKSESAIQLDALMPSILSKAFRGELRKYA